MVKLISVVDHTIFTYADFLFSTLYFHKLLIILFFLFLLLSVFIFAGKIFATGGIPPAEQLSAPSRREKPFPLGEDGDYC